MGEERGWPPMLPIPCPKLANGFESNGLKKSITEPRFFLSEVAVIAFCCFLFRVYNLKMTFDSVMVFLLQAYACEKEFLF